MNDRETDLVIANYLLMDAADLEPWGCKPLNARQLSAWNPRSASCIVDSKQQSHLL